MQLMGSSVMHAIVEREMLVLILLMVIGRQQQRKSLLEVLQHVSYVFSKKRSSIWEILSVHFRKLKLLRKMAWKLYEMEYRTLYAASGERMVVWNTKMTVKVLKSVAAQQIYVMVHQCHGNNHLRSSFSLWLLWLYSSIDVILDGYYLHNQTIFWY